MNETRAAFRITDANLNRLREALRVLEEYVRFATENSERSIELKQLRHSLETIEADAGRVDLIAARDTSNDCFANDNRPEELNRAGINGLVAANIRRGQEAARVIEEYGKLILTASSVLLAKKIRFSLYALEQQLTGSTNGAR